MEKVFMLSVCFTKIMTAYAAICNEGGYVQSPEIKTKGLLSACLLNLD